MMTEEGASILNQFAYEIFLEKADMDYISARTLYRYDCFDEFLYMSHQAIEKYLKTILLYNYVENNKGGHNLVVLMNKIIDNIDSVNLEKDTQSFIQEIDKVEYAEAVRYKAAPFYGDSSYLFLLDTAVWDLRIYCRLKDTDDIVTKLLSINKSKIDDLKFKWPSIIPFGTIEKILLDNDDSKYKKLRSNLTWNNFCYGRRKKKSVKKFQYRRWSKNPPYLYRGIETLGLLKKYVYIPDKITKSLSVPQNNDKNQN